MATSPVVETKRLMLTAALLTPWRKLFAVVALSVGMEKKTPILWRMLIVLLGPKVLKGQMKGAQKEG